MKSHTVEHFWKLFAALPADVRKQAYKAYALFSQDPFHPSLKFKDVRGRHGVWSVRINDDYRALGYRKDGEMRWFWIGSHTEYDKLLSGR